jgi:AcrR family transcriptional regulator
MSRTAQKARTKRDLIAAAIGLIQAGEVPTLDATAIAADVSRATAYRYFPNHADLLEAAYHEAVIEPFEARLETIDGSEDPAERLEILISLICQSLIENEQGLREMLRASVTTTGTPGTSETPLRRGRRPRWIEHALEPVRTELGQPAFDQLVSAITAATGIEAMVVLRDIRGLSAEQACETIGWTAQAILRSAREPS